MIRTLWVGVNVAASTLSLGTVAILASLLRVRGDLYSRLTRSWSRWILWSSNTPLTIHGLEHLDPDVPRVLVSNHVSAYDILAVAAVVPGRFAFVAKKELESVPFFGAAWKAAGHISIDRSNRQRAMESLQQAGERIRRERSTVIIYPEGTRSRTGELLEFKKGAFLLAVEARVPVVPAVVVGTREIIDARRWRIRPRPIHLYIEPPISTVGFSAANTEVLLLQVRTLMHERLQQAQLPEQTASPRSDKVTR